MGWDSYLINKFHCAQRIVNNQKVVLSGYCGSYFYMNGNKNNVHVMVDLGYNQWRPGEFWVDNTIPKWSDVEIKYFPNELLNMVEETGFAPASKIVAMFMFGNHHLAKNLSIYDDILFWEEELLQSMELIHNGFTLVHPGKISPIYHFYIDAIMGDLGYRDKAKKFLPDLESKNKYTSAIKNNYLKHVSNKENLHKVKKFEEYNSIDMIKGAENHDIYPKEYANVGFLPVI